MRIDIDGIDLETETDDLYLPEDSLSREKEAHIKNIVGAGKILRMLINQNENILSKIAIRQLDASVDIAILGVYNNGHDS